MDGHKLDGQLHGLAGKGIDAHHRTQKQQNGPVEQAHGQVSPQSELAGVVHGLLVVPRTDALAHHGDHGKAQGFAGDDAHAVQIVSHRVGSDLHRTECGDHAHHQDASGLEQAVLKGGRDADAQNALCHLCIQPGGLWHRDGIALLVALAQDKGRCHHTGQHAGPCNTVYAHFKSEDAHCVAHNVDHVHQKADLHGDLGVAHAAEQCRTAVIQCQKRITDGDDAQVQHAGIQHIGIDGTVEQPDHRSCKNKTECPHQQTEYAAEQKQLARACIGLLLLPRTQKLAYHHCAASGQRRKQHDDEVVDHVHKADTGNGRFAAAGHHHGIGHTHGHFQQLLHQQRAGQQQQFLLCEQRLPPSEERLFCSAHRLIFH